MNDMGDCDESGLIVAAELAPTHLLRLSFNVIQDLPDSKVEPRLPTLTGQGSS